ncbi:MAG: DUF72 domain-containing protein [Pedobacter sp.]|jgi:uncharacterized protein YecE (DUF72 family)|uniref:DUF72 domain-containing protein n=1 Tax=Pedobacter sp. TaxID=1411316 RepID=UPI0035613424
MNWRIGCSGFYYREWKEVFYPKGLEQKDWFKFYCQHFNTIEINSTFYKMPTQKSFEKWYTESPADFVFTIKAPRLITHYKQLKECTALLADFYLAVVNGLTDKLACVLFQFPPKFDYTAERLQLLIDLLDPTLKNVVEFRHTSWWDEEIYSKLAEHNIIFCGQSYPSALSDKVVKNNARVYYRFHGKPVLYKSAYAEEVMKDLVAQVPRGTEEAFIYFNNTWGTGALTNARQLQELTKE